MLVSRGLGGKCDRVFGKFFGDLGEIGVLWGCFPLLKYCLSRNVVTYGAVGRSGCVPVCCGCGLGGFDTRWRWIPGGWWLLLVGFGWYSAPWVGGVLGAWVAVADFGGVWDAAGVLFFGSSPACIVGSAGALGAVDAVGIGRGSLWASGPDLI